MKKSIWLMLAVGIVGIINVFAVNNVFADCAGVPTGTINCDGNNGVTALLSLALNIMTYGVGIMGVFGILVAGYMYMTAGDDSSRVAKAKNMIIQVVIGLLCYSALWLGLKFLMPGDLEQNLQKIETVETVERDNSSRESESETNTTPESQENTTEQ